MKRIRIGSMPSAGKRLASKAPARKSSPITTFVEGMVKARQINLFPGSPIPKLLRLRSR